MISYYLLFPLIALLGNLFLMGLVLGTNPKRRTNRVFALVCLAVIIWNFGNYMLSLASSEREAQFWLKVYLAGVFFIPATFFHFTLALTEDFSKLKKILCLSGYILSFIFLCLNQTSLLTKNATLYPWGYYPTVQQSSFFTGLVVDFCFFVFAFLGCAQLLCKLRNSVGIKRNQIKYVLIGCITGFGLGTTAFLPVYGVKILPCGNIGSLFHTATVAYAIVKYRLMDINVVIRKSVVYSIMTGLITGIYLLILIFSQAIYRKITNYTSLVPAIAFGLIFVFLFNHIREKVQWMVDKFFFKNRLEYQEIAKNFTDRIIYFINLENVCVFLIDTITKTFGVKKSALMLLDKETEEYLISASYGINESVQLTTRFDKTDGLIDWLSQNRRELFLHEILENPVIRAACTKDIRKIEKLGAELIMPMVNKDELIGLLFLGQKGSEDIYNEDDIKFLFILVNHATIAIERTTLYQTVQSQYLETVYALAAALEARDEYTRGHSHRVTQYAEEIARRMKVPQEMIETIRKIGLLHDIGKIGIEESILRKPGPLTEEEWEIMRSHVVIGENILKPARSLALGLPIVRNHHERLDGDGYPDGLSGNNLGLVIRIFTVADAFDAMTSDRPYRPRLTQEAAIEELKRCSCNQFDLHVVRAFLAVLAERKRREFRRDSVEVIQ